MPLITILGLQFGALLAGSIITETIFAWPGLGRLTIQAIHTRDYPVVQGCVLVIALSYVVGEPAHRPRLYAWLDPAMRAACDDARDQPRARPSPRRGARSAGRSSRADRRSRRPAPRLAPYDPAAHRARGGPAAAARSSTRSARISSAATPQPHRLGARVSLAVGVVHGRALARDRRDARRARRASSAGWSTSWSCASSTCCWRSRASCSRSRSAAVLGPSLANVVLALCVIGWTGYARLSAAEVLALRERDVRRSGRCARRAARAHRAAPRPAAARGAARGPGHVRHGGCDRRRASLLLPRPRARSRRLRRGERCSNDGPRLPAGRAPPHRLPRRSRSSSPCSALNFLGDGAARSRSTCARAERRDSPCSARRRRSPREEGGADGVDAAPRACPDAPGSPR